MMNNELDNRLSLELKERRGLKNSSPPNHEIYRNRLLDEFPLDLPLPGDTFYANSFTGDDEVDYLKGRAIFEGKTWREVDFDILYHDYVQFVPLLPRGRIYYLPAFLSYFYDMRHPNSEFRQVLVSGICDGFGISTIDEIEERMRGRKTIAADYSQFEIFNPSQSKLIAMFLVNEANFSHADSVQARTAQMALTSYWGNFLLF